MIINYDIGNVSVFMISYHDKDDKDNTLSHLYFCSLEYSTLSSIMLTYR